MTIDEKVEIFRAFCVGFGHTKGTDLSKGSFTLGTGRDYDLYSYTEVEAMLNEISLALETGNLSPCQKSVLHQLKSYGVLQAFHAIEAELKLSEKD